eukprot:gene9638-12977_t
MFITGYSGRFPNADSVLEFYDALKNKKDLVGDSKRYPLGYHGLPDRAGHLKTIDKFDSNFFRMNKLHVEGMDPQTRMLLEVVYEALADSHLSAAKIKGSNTGVYVGNCFSDYHNGIVQNISSVNGYENVGSATSMSANKISYFFDLTGPSLSIDTACSSSLVALDRACQDISNGIIDRAIVGGVSLNLRPTVSKVFQKYNMLSPTGTCHSFDDSADGYCRSEAIVAIIIESNKLVKEGYASIIGHGVNSNGACQQGITYPSVAGQSGLIDEVCKRFKIDKSDIGYIEAHGTGTVAGDGVEITALNNSYAIPNQTIPIGSIKSNMGHAEGASGLCSVIKCLLMYETETILPNLHYCDKNSHSVSTKHEPLIQERFRVVTEVEMFDTSKAIAINNFGFGGVNGHVVLKSGRLVSLETHSKLLSYPSPQDKYYVYGRTYKSVEKELLEGNKTSFFVTRLEDINKFPYRGVIQISPNELAENDIPSDETKNNTINHPIIKKIENFNPKLAFVYSGQGSQYKFMAKSLFQSNQTFYKTIERLSSALTEISNKAIDLLELFKVGTLWDDKRYSSLGITSVQIGLTNMLKEKGFQPDYILGHSLGEITCSYADGCLSEVQCIQIAFVRSHLVSLLNPNTFLYSFDHKLDLDSFLNSSLDADGVKLINQYDGVSTYQVIKSLSETFEKVFGTFMKKLDCHGNMVYVSLTEAVANDIIRSFKFEGKVVIGCYNTVDGLTLSGPAAELDQIRKYLVENSIFHRLVDTDGIAYHSPIIAAYKSFLIEQLTQIIPNSQAPKRSSKWISTSDVDNSLCDAKYHSINITESVYFTQAIAKLPDNCTVVEIGPHDGLLSQVKRSGNFSALLSCMSKKEPDAERSFDKLIDSFWLYGIFPVEVLPISSLSVIEDRYRIKWDHEETWKIVDYKTFERNNNSQNQTVDGFSTIIYDLKADYKFLLDHVIQNQALFPAMGHVYTIWRVVGIDQNIVIESFQIFRAIVLEGVESIEFTFKLNQETRKIEILHSNELVASAIVKKSDDLVLSQLKEVTDDKPIFVSGNDIYSSFNRYDYNYQDTFQVIDKQTIDGKLSIVSDVDDVLHWINYLDGMLQCSIYDVSCLRLPTSIKSIQLRPLQKSEAFPKIIEVDHNAGNIISNCAVIEELTTTVAPKSVKDLRSSTIKAVTFIPYDTNTVKVPMVAPYKYNYIKYCHQALTKMLTEPFLLQYPHLKNLFTFIKNYDDESIEYFDQPVFNITRDIYLDPVGLLENPLLVMSKHEQYKALYETDVLFAASKSSLQTCIDIIHENVNEKYKFLEVGTGTGGALRRVYPLIARNISSYTASDISVINLDENFNQVKTVRWNVNDPYPESNEKFHVIFGSNSVHCGSSMLNTLGQLSNALVEGGFILLEEYVSELPIYLWGLDSFIWETAVDQRDYGLWITHQRWMGLFKEAGLEMITCFNNDATCLFLLRKVSSNELKLIQNVDSNKNKLKDSLTLVDIDSSSGLIATPPSLVITGSGNDGVLGFVKCLAKEPSIANSIIGYLVPPTAVSNKISAAALAGIEKKLLTNVIHNDVHGSFREVDINDISSLSSLQNSKDWMIQIDKPGFLSSLFYKQQTILEDYVNVSFVGLNFKDVMLSYGKLKLDSNTVSLGIEYSGFFGSNNDRIMGIGMNCLSNKLPISSTPLRWTIPKAWSLEEAATVPCVYTTVYYCLDHCSKIQPGQSILIHAGAGGIGQAAIHICLSRGITVYTTCSESKRSFIKQQFNLPDDHIFNSRDLSFYNQLMLKTNNKGVTVVLNSLSEQMLLTSLECVAKFGHFCEIGKYDIMSDNKIGLKVFAKNISFHGVDISEMLYDEIYNNILHKLVQAGLDNNEVKPLFVDSTFPHQKLEDAIRYMGAGSHKGKILIEVNTENSSLKPSQSITIRPVYSTSGVHMITGGLGGFGLELAEWLVKNGAESVLLLSRTGKVDGYQTRKLAKYSQLQVVKCDCTVLDELEQVFQNNKSLTGIWHLAMNLQDSLFQNMTDDQWNQCVSVKMMTANHLDLLSKKHCTTTTGTSTLQDFVLFSSISSLFGNAGQSNYGYGNACMEQLCYEREKCGLPAKAICWGRIGNVGYVSKNSKKIGKVTADLNIDEQHIDQCLDDLHTILTTCNAPVMSCYKLSIISNDDSLNGTNELLIIDLVLRALGVDKAKTSDHDNLTELGVDSLQVVTIKSILNGKGFEKTVAEIYQLKISDLKAMN